MTPRPLLTNDNLSLNGHSGDMYVLHPRSQSPITVPHTQDNMELSLPFQGGPFNRLPPEIISKIFVAVLDLGGSQVYFENAHAPLARFFFQ